MNSRELEANAYKFKMSEIYNFNTHKIEAADYWLSQGEEIIFKLRYNLRKNKKSYGCPICKTPVILKKGQNTRAHFAHLKREEGVKCILCDEDMSDREKRIQKYNYAKESEEHKKLKEFIGTYLHKSPRVSGIKLEKNKKGEFTSWKWKRPDVQCKYGDISLVFEVQTSNTWLSDIVERDEFYKSNKTFIIWIFNNFNSCQPTESITRADIFYNNPEINLFVLDQNAQIESEKRSQLILNCFYQIPEVDYTSKSIKNIWKNRLIKLEDLTFEPNLYKPFLISYHDKKEKAEQLLKRSKNGRAIFEVDEKIYLKNEPSKTNFSSHEELRFEVNDDSPKRFESLSPNDCLKLLFGDYISRNVYNLKNIIKDLNEKGFDFPMDTLEILEERKWIRKIPGNISQVHYERNL